MAVISGDTGIVFAGYLDDAEEMLRGMRRVLVIVDDSNVIDNLPTIGESLEFEDGSKTAKFAAGSIAIVRGGGRVILGTDGNWG